MVVSNFKKTPKKKPTPIRRKSPTTRCELQPGKAYHNINVIGEFVFSFLLVGLVVGLIVGLAVGLTVGEMGWWWG